MKLLENYLLGMDCGTTNIKAIILGEDGKQIAEASRPSKFICTEMGMQEQDANEWWENTKEIFLSLSQQVGEKVVRKIRGICISSHTVSMLPVDEEGAPVRNAITYQDGRSYKEMNYIVEKMGLENFIKTVGGQPAVSFLPNKILWYKNNEKENFDKTAYFLQASSFLNFKLTGVMSSDIDQAQRTQCFDVDKMDWSKEIGQIIGVNLHQYLPKIYQVDEIIGYTTEKVANEVGLLPGIPVLAGCSDAMASMFAAGVSKLGECGESSGTSSLVFIGSKEKSAPNLPVVTRPCAVDGMPWVFDAPITTTGAALKWFIDKFAAEERAYCEEHNRNIYDYLNEKALCANPGSGGLLFFPYLMGERAPLWNEYAKGMFIGLSMTTSREDLIRAVFEGTAFALRHVVETVKESGGKCDLLKICGGGAKSRTWAMIKASMLHCPVYLQSDGSGDVPVGDAILAGRKVGVFSSLAEAVEKSVSVKEIIEPVPAWEEVYDKLYPYYVSMYQKLDGDLKSFRDEVVNLSSLKIK